MIAPLIVSEQKSPTFRPQIRRAPKRELSLSKSEMGLALRNALRYVKKEDHQKIAAEFAEELQSRGRIYGYRFRPRGDEDGNIKAKGIDAYEGVTLAGKALQLMMDNNLDFNVALYPYELVTYGETGQVCQNWMQYLQIQNYLKKLRNDQTLVVMSGHPLGIFPSHRLAPRVIITNSLMIGMFDNQEEWRRAAALGVANYGQMTAGGWMYIGPQGIVHGTYNTLMIAAKKKLRSPNLQGKIFVTSGLGGMSGAQGKAIKIAGGVGIISEVDVSRIQTRLQQGWIDSVHSDPKEIVQLAMDARRDGRSLALAHHGNIIELLEYFVSNNISIDLLSDQTSCHAVYDGGYCPAGMSFETRTQMLQTQKNLFRDEVDRSLRRHYEAVSTLVSRGTFFFDYGNAFLKAIFDSGVREIARNGKDEKEGFIWESYVEDLLGPELFDYGYGPFRWVCLSGNEDDLSLTDAQAADCIEKLRTPMRWQDEDNWNWVRDAHKNKLVVGSQARILYQDAEGRVAIAKRFNQLVRERKVGPIMLGRDHHDTGGTDSPFRETANIKDGSNIMADMATQIFAGDCARGMTLCALHNGGGTGIGKSINGGFGLLLDGSDETDRIIETAMCWDVMGGVARRAWARNANSMEAIEKFNSRQSENFHVLLPEVASEDEFKHLF